MKQVVIIGGGLAGCASAEAFSRRGWQVRVLEALATVNRAMGTTTVIITHNADIAKMAQRVLWMQDGQIVREAVNERPLAASELEW